MEIRRQGRVIKFINRQTPAEHDAFLDQMRDLATRLPEEMRKKVASLRLLIADLPLAQTLSDLTVSRYTANPETFIEPEIPSYLGLEYLTWLFITNDPPPAISGPPALPNDLERVHELLDELIHDVQWKMSTSHLVAPSRRGPEMDELIVRARTQHLLVRGHAYAHHMRQQIQDLFGPFAGDLKANLGFDADQAIRMTKTLGNVVNSRLYKLQAELFAGIERWTTALEHPEMVLDLTPEEIATLAEAKTYSDPVKALRDVQILWFFYQTQTAFSIRPIDIAETAGVAEPEARAFLKHFSLALGHTPVADSLPSVYEDQVLAPLVNLGDDTWLAHLVPHLTWAAKATFERTLSNGGPTWDRYDRHRARYLETRTRQLLAGIGQHATGWQNLKYVFDDGSGTQEFELDSLIQIDGALLLVECKSGVMSASARRGGTDRLADDLGDLVSHAFAQASRAERFVKSAESVTFKASDQEIEVRRDAVRRTFLISTTLDPLSAFVTHAGPLRRLGLVPADSRVWSVYLPDLQVIADLVGGSGEFLHYLARREDLESLNVNAHDELDWFGHYLLEGLYFDAVRTGEVPRMSLNTYTTGFDDWYSFQSGERQTPVQKPSQAIPAVLRAMIERLESEGPPGFTDATFLLLDGDTAARGYLANAIEKQRRRGAQIGQAGFRIFIGDRALAFLSAPSADRATLDAYAESALEVKPVHDVVAILEPRDGSPLIVSMRRAGPRTPDGGGPTPGTILTMRSRFEVPPGAKRAEQQRRRRTRPGSR